MEGREREKERDTQREREREKIWGGGSERGITYWVGSAIDRKSTLCSYFTLGSTIVSWCRKKQSFVALSIREEDYIALSVAVCKEVWLLKLVTNLFNHEMDPTTIHCDNQSYVNISENLVFHDKSKHIEIKYHYIRDMVQIKIVQMKYLSTHEQIADIFTKTLSKTNFNYFHERLGLVENASLAKREC